MRQRPLLLVVLFAFLFAGVLSETPSECDASGNCKVEEQKKRIAIVGGGIAGSSTAYYVSELIPDAEITIYEKDDQVCGRVTDTTINGNNVEVGGSIYHESNHNVDGFVTKFNLTRQSPFGGSTVGIWNGKEFIFRPSDVPILGDVIDIAKMFYRYGMSPYHLKNYLNSMLSNWSKLYEFEEPSETVDDFFRRMDLHDEAIALGPEFLEQYGISREFTRDILGPMTRVNYNTPVDIMNAFGVAVSAIGSGNDIYGVAEGNKKICSNLVKHSKARAHYGSKVATISRDSSGTYSIETTKDKASFDAVIIATPLELAGIKFEGVEVDEFVFKAREYRLVHITFVAGVLNPTYFNVEGPVPTVILTVDDPSVPFSSIGRTKNVTTADGRPVSKIFSIQPISDDLLQRMFINGTVVHKREIHAYPILRPPHKFVPIKLAENLYYVNAMESVISTIETETISAKNVARLLAKAWGQPYTRKL